MSNVLSKGTLFPPELTSELINQVRGKSSLAALSDMEPVRFNGQTIFTFSLDKEVDVVAENGAKSNGGATVGTVSMTPVKIEYGVRVSDEFVRGSEEVRLGADQNGDVSGAADDANSNVEQGGDVSESDTPPAQPE